MTGTPHRGWLTWLPALLMVLGSSPVGAQEPVSSFDLLNRRLVVGDTVWVTDVEGREVKGKLAELQPESLTLDVGEPRTFPAGDVRLVQKRSGRSAGRGSRWGLILGGAAALVTYAATVGGGACTSDCTGGGWAIAMGFGMGIGAGVGAIVGTAVPGKKHVLYQMPGESTRMQFSVTPTFGRHSKAVRLSFAF